MAWSEAARKAAAEARRRHKGQNKYLPASHMQGYTPSAPAHGKARRWVRNENVWAIKTRGSFHNINSKAIVSKKLFGRELDSRYTGNKSAYGQAIRRMRSYVAQSKFEALIKAAKK